MIKHTSDEIITSVKDTTLALSAEKKHIRSHVSENKKMRERILKRGRSSISKNTENDKMNKEVAKKLEESKDGFSSSADRPNLEKESFNRNEQSNSSAKHVCLSTPNSLKTLETYIEKMGIDVPSNRHLLAYNRVSKVIMNDGFYISPSHISENLKLLLNLH